MADETFRVILPAVRAVDNGDGTFSFSIKDVNSDEALVELGSILAAIEALRVVSTLDTIEAAVEALRVISTLDSVEAAVEALRVISTLDTVEAQVAALIGYLPIDAATNARNSIDYAHHEIHAGDSFISDFTDDTMTTNDTLILAFKTPNTTKWSHLIISAWALTIADVQILEGPTWTTGTGSQNPIYNRDRNSVNASDLLEDTTGAFVANNALILNPTGLAGGTVIHDLNVGADKKIGGETPRGISEFILKQDTTYAIVLTAKAVNSAGQVILNWYEHTNAA